MESPSVPQLHLQINKTSDKHKITLSPAEEIRQPLQQNRKTKHNENCKDRQTFLREQIRMQNTILSSGIEYQKNTLVLRFYPNNYYYYGVIKTTFSQMNRYFESLVV